MALRANSVYAYTDLSEKQVFVKTTDLTDMLDWSSSVAYVVRNAALYNGAYYVCLTANTNTPPDGNLSDEWSVLVLTRDGSSQHHTADEAYALAEEALDTAIEVGQSGSNYAFDLFVQGTEYTNTQAVAAIGQVAQQGSNYAFELYVAGTNYTNEAAVEAITVASQQGSEYAFGLYVAGTNYTQTQAIAAVNAEAAVRAQHDLDEAAARVHDDGTIAQYGSQFTTIVRDFGTNYTNQQIAVAVFNVGNSGSEFAIITRDQGTNFTIAQVSAEAAARVNGDSAVQVFATNYTNQQVNIESAQRIHDDGTIASSGSAWSYLLYTAGTNYAQSLVQAEAAIRAAFDFQYFVAGTNYTDLKVQQQQVQSGSESLALYWAGTAFTDLRVTTERIARTDGDQALETWIGTNTSNISQLASILGASFNGTFSLYMAQVSRGKPDTKITVVGGVVTGLVQSPYIWEDFTQYTPGTAPASFDKGSSWSGTSFGSITTETFAGTVGQDNIQGYDFTGTFNVLNGGYGFNVSGQNQSSYFTQLGIDSFETYALGTIVNPNMNAGTTFTQPAVIFSY
jgi:hypothetical protein